jgi:hypothetical protein
MLPYMKNDQRAKLWMHLTSSRSPYQLESIKIIHSNVFVPHRIDFYRAAAFVGSHGTGKSVLLRMIKAAFGYPERRAKIWKKDVDESFAVSYIDTYNAFQWLS